MSLTKEELTDVKEFIDEKIKDAGVTPGFDKRENFVLNTLVTPEQLIAARNFLTKRRIDNDTNELVVLEIRVQELKDKLGV